MSTPNTPFPTTGYYGPEYFCNRREETETLTKNLKSGISTTLISIRRMGKTGLIHHVLHHLNKEYITIYADLLPTETLSGFLNTLTTAVINTVPQKSKTGQKLWEAIKSLRPVLTFDNFSGMPEVTFDTSSQTAGKNIETILNLLEKQNKPVIIAIDEFQQILNYPETHTDAWLRSIIQRLNNVVFIFSGSRQHLMTDLFNTPSRPFYRSTVLLRLEKIPADEYREFIINKFKEHGRSIPEEVTDEILEWTQRHTYYVQLLAARIYITQKKKITSECWKEEAFKLLKEQEMVFFNYRELLSEKQWKLLKAIAAESPVYQISSNDFLSRHKLGSSASVIRALEGLTNKEMVYYDYDKEGNKFYQVYDLLFQRWIENNYAAH